MVLEPSSVGILLSCMALALALGPADAAENGRRYPQPETPPFWKGRLGEIEAAVKAVKRGKTDVLLNFHSHASPPAILPTRYVPRFHKEAEARFAERLMARYREAGLPAGKPPVPAEDGVRYPPPSFNLTSALHHVCGGLSMLFECPHGVTGENYPSLTHDQILDLQLILFEELLAFAVESPRPVGAQRQPG